MLSVDPDRRITIEQLWGHPWLKAASRWEPLGASIYQISTDAGTGAVYADEQLVAELEAAGYARQMVLQVRQGGGRMGVSGCPVNLAGACRLEALLPGACR
jgi:hypothetical protein